MQHLLHNFILYICTSARRNAKIILLQHLFYYIVLLDINTILSFYYDLFK